MDQPFDARGWAWRDRGRFFKGEWVGRAAQALWAHPVILGIGGGLLVLAYALQLWIDRRMDRDYSRFWHPVRMSLSSALGLHMLPSDARVVRLRWFPNPLNLLNLLNLLNPIRYRGVQLVVDGLDGQLQALRRVTFVACPS